MSKSGRACLVDFGLLSIMTSPDPRSSNVGPEIDTRPTKPGDIYNFSTVCYQVPDLIVLKANIYLLSISRYTPGRIHF